MNRLAAASLDAALWASRPQPCMVTNCKGFARAARELVGIRGWMHRQAGEVAGDVWAQIRGDGFEAEVARHIGRRIPLPTDEAFSATARCLRALGILCCLNADRDMMKCQCLHDTAVDLTRAQLEAELREMATERFWDVINSRR